MLILFALQLELVHLVTTQLVCITRRVQQVELALAQVAPPAEEFVSAPLQDQVKERPIPQLLSVAYAQLTVPVAPRLEVLLLENISRPELAATQVREPHLVLVRDESLRPRLVMEREQVLAQNAELCYEPVYHQGRRRSRLHTRGSSPMDGGESKSRRKYGIYGTF